MEKGGRQWGKEFLDDGFSTLKTISSRTLSYTISQDYTKDRKVQTRRLCVLGYGHRNKCGKRSCNHNAEDGAGGIGFKRRRLRSDMQQESPYETDEDGSRCRSRNNYYDSHSETSSSAMHSRFKSWNECKAFLRAEIPRPVRAAIIQWPESYFKMECKVRLSGIFREERAKTVCELDRILVAMKKSYFDDYEQLWFENLEYLLAPDDYICKPTPVQPDGLVKVKLLGSDIE
ncbi:hypothetical protein MFIFM68171_00150 [Madurella fahalii]|uniref:Uncharacterized protein n=1 Tax=Madurella fahalii TaxID=1157608 RepID=A0ABQ0FWR8_9PEZI